MRIGIKAYSHWNASLGNAFNDHTYKKQRKRRRFEKQYTPFLAYGLGIKGEVFDSKEVFDGGSANYD